jgi:hypothetical protein
METVRVMIEADVEKWSKNVETAAESLKEDVSWHLRGMKMLGTISRFDVRIEPTVVEQVVIAPGDGHMLRR